MNASNLTTVVPTPDKSRETLLIVSGLGVASQFALAAYFLYNSRMGLGTKREPFNRMMPRSSEMSDLGVISPLICGTYYWLYFAFNFQSDEVVPDLKLWMYVSYLGSCPILFLDFCYQVGLRYIICNSVLVVLCLIIGRIAETSQAPGTQLSLFLLASCFIAWIFAQIAYETRVMWPLINKDARRWLLFAWYAFTSSWIVFPMIFISRYFVQFPVSHEADSVIIRVVLDFIAKGVYTFGIMRFRLCMEDLELHDIAMLGDSSVLHATRRMQVCSYRMRIALSSAIFGETNHDSNYGSSDSRLDSSANV